MPFAAIAFATASRPLMLFTATSGAPLRRDQQPNGIAVEVTNASPSWAAALIAELTRAS
jgi:hypothetical protein